MRILVVDDSRAMRRYIRRALEGGGHASGDILEAENGAEALTLLTGASTPVDMVLADWNMPVMDGIDLLKAMKAAPALAEIPVIMVTGEARRDRVLEALNLGARNYIVKPFDAETLCRKVLAAETSMSGRLRAAKSEAEAKPASEGDQLLADLSSEIVEEVYRSATTSSLEDGERIFQAGDLTESLYLVLKGSITLVEPAAGEVVATVGRGECVNGRMFILNLPAEADAAADGPTVVAALSEDRLRELSTAYPELNRRLVRLAAEGAVSGGTAATRATGLSGQLDLMPLSDLIPALAAGSKTGVLRVTNGARRGLVYVREGAVEHAELGGVSGREALFEMLGWTTGSFSLGPYASPRAATISEGTMGLLMEWARLSDEAGLSSAGRTT